MFDIWDVINFFSLLKISAPTNGFNHCLFKDDSLREATRPKAQTDLECLEFSIRGKKWKPLFYIVFLKACVFALVHFRLYSRIPVHLLLR